MKSQFPMIYFSDNLIDKAKAIISKKEDIDTAKACRDIFEVETILTYSVNNLQYNRAEAINLNIRLQNDYPCINTIKNIKLPINGSKKNNAVGSDGVQFDGLIEELKIDRAGICAAVLIKKEIIKSVEELVD